ncbi:MAG: TetR family transcriptional regulator [Alphaproteobacteria bacterium]|nr:TetR family transcriptional regulator [Alphaproteobacteria bacterium]
MAFVMDEKKGVTPARAEFAAKVLKAAWQLFVEKGYAGTSMDDVAAAVGVSKPTVYEAYKNKQHLFEAVINTVTDEFDPVATQQIADYQGSMADLFRVIPGAVRVFVRQQRRTDLVRVLISEGRRMPFLVAKYREALWERELGAWAKLLGAAMDRGEFRRMDPMVAARICAAPAINIMVERIVYGDNTVPDEIVDAFVDEAFAGIARAYVTSAES